MNKKQNKKALSPIITTILLILVSLVLAGIIFAWAKSFGSEQVAKFDEPIENSCVDVRLQAAITGANSVSVINQGSIPVYKLRFLIEGDGNSDKEDKEVNIIAGGATSVTTIANLIGKEVTLMPVLLGTLKDDSTKSEEFPCTSAGIALV